MRLEDKLLFLAEGFDFEVKAAQGADGMGELPKDFWRTYSAFANTEGGVVLLGVKEPKPGQFEVVGLKDPEKVRRSLWSLLGDRTKTSANLLRDDDVVVSTLEDKSILRIRIPRAPRTQSPVYIHGNPLTGTFRRLHEGDHLCSETDVRRMIAEATDGQQDGRVLERFGWEDLDADSFTAYRKAFAARKPDHPFTTQDDEAFLQSIGGWGKDRERGHSGLTVAGLLMFGRWRSIVETFPDYVLDYRDLPADPSSTRYLDRLVTDGLWSGNLYDFYRRVYTKLTADLKVPFRLKGDERQEESPVHEAIREGLANCLIHADYRGRLAILVERRPGMVLFRNPGRMRVAIAQAIRGGESDCRNRVLQNMFFLAGRGDRLGSGVPTIFQNWKGQHWREPEIWEDLEPEAQTLLRLRMESLLPREAVAAVQARFGKRFRDLSEVGRIALVTVEVEGFLTHGRLRQLCEGHPHDLSQELACLVEQGFLESDKRGRGTSYRFPGTGELRTSGGANDRWSPQSGDRSPHLGGSSPHSASSSPHLEASSPHLDLPSASTAPEDDPGLKALAAPIAAKGKAKVEDVQATIVALCRGRFLSLRQLATLLDRHPKHLRDRFLTPLVRKNRLEWLYPNSPNHEQQAYRTVHEDLEHI